MRINNIYIKGSDIYIKGSKFEPVFTQQECRLGVRYIVATYGNLKVYPMRPKDFAARYDSRLRHKNNN